MGEGGGGERGVVEGGGGIKKDSEGLNSNSHGVASPDSTRQRNHITDTANVIASGRYIAEAVAAEASSQKDG